MSRFDSKVALVTGASGGIGGAISERLAAEGATVVLADVTTDNSERAAAELRDRKLEAYPCLLDVTSPESIQSGVASIVADHGPVDILVNNAGINRRGALLDLTEDDWNASIAVNLSSMFLLTRAVLPGMVERRSGAIVNTASQWGLHPAPGHIAYNVTKAGVVSFTQSLARDYAPYGVRVNAVAPGEILTPMVEANLAKKGIDVAELDAKVPFGRVGRPEEVAALVAFLASDDAPFMCGSVVEITGAQAVS
jgi:NAD(P)-dependent dehydrogenase (short-subunit alcohol dehydrogenase family)